MLSIIVKYIIKSMMENKSKSLLLVFAISLSAAMFFSSVTISDTLVKMQIEQWRSSYGHSNIVVYGKGNGVSPFFFMNGAEKYSDYFEYIVGTVSGFGLYRLPYGKTLYKDDTIGLSLMGMELDDLQKLTPVNIYKQSNLYPFKGMKVVISKKAADDLKLEIGDSMLIEINGGKHRFIICGIALPTGPFQSEGHSSCVLIPRNTLNVMLNAKGKVDMLYLKLKDMRATNIMLVKLSQQYGKYIVRQSFSIREVKKETNRIATPILIVTIVLSFLSVYIIHSTFKIIIMNKLPILGTFRSIGAKKVTVNLVVITESVIYGVIGGLFGCGGGICLLHIMAYYTNPYLQEGIKVPVEFSLYTLLSTFLLAVFLSIIGSIVSIIKTASIPVKNIVLNITDSVDKNNLWRLIVGLGLLISVIIIVMFLDYGASIVISTGCIVLLFGSVILIAPFVIDSISKVLIRFYTFLLGGEATLALLNIKGSGAMMSSISMLMIGISSLFMINTVNYSDKREITDCFDRTHYDITMNMDNVNKATLSIIKAVNGVKDVTGNQYINNIGIEGTDNGIWHLQGIDTKTFHSWHEIRIPDEEKNTIFSLDEGRNILITFALKDRLKVDKGDTIKLKVYKNGILRKYDYKVTGFFKNLLPGWWSYALISQRNFKLDIQSKDLNPIYIKASIDVNKVMDNLKTEFSSKKPIVQTIGNMKEEIIESNGQLFSILGAFSILTLFMGSFGILNNITICFIQRKHSLAVLRSIGMSKLKMIKMMLIESVTIGVVGTIAGVCLGAFVTFTLVPRVIKALDIENTIYFSKELTILCLLLGVSIAVLASVGPSLKMLGMDVVKAIKYE